MREREKYNGVLDQMKANGISRVERNSGLKYLVYGSMRDGYDTDTQYTPDYFYREQTGIDGVHTNYDGRELIIMYEYAANSLKELCRDMQNVQDITIEAGRATAAVLLKDIYNELQKSDESLIRKETIIHLGNNIVFSAYDLSNITGTIDQLLDGIL